MDEKLQLLESLSTELIDAILSDDYERQFVIFKEYQKIEVDANGYY